MARREKGTGSVSQRKDGTWRGIIDLGRGAEGKRKTITVYGKTEKEAKKKLREKQEELCKFDYQEIPKLTLGELLDDWKDTVKRLEVKSTSFDLIENTIDLHIKPEIGYIQIANLTYRDIQLYIIGMTDKGYAFSTIKKAYNAINASLRWAIQQDFIRKNPCVDVKLPKQNKRAKSDIEFFTDAEVDTIIKGALFRYKTGKYMYKHGYAIVLLLNTGMRVGELLALKWKNVNFRERQIYVCETRHQIKDRTDSEQKYVVVDSTTKTKSSCRYIPINDDALAALEYFRDFGYKNPYVMANSDHNVITYRNLFRVLDNIKKANGINHGSIHTLRHTFATMLFRKGVDIKVISELLGHSDISITYDIYTHVIEEQKQKAVDVLNVLSKLSEPGAEKQQEVGNA